MTDLIVVGGGPRGLATALYAAVKGGFKITLIDPQPLHTWEPPFMVPNLVMRSPLTFDLTTGCKELSDYSLCKFIGHSIPFTSNQREIEYHPAFPTRQTFVEYLRFIYNTLVDCYKVNVIKQQVRSLSSKLVVTEDGQELEVENLVVATGNHYGEAKVPSWINRTQLLKRTIPKSKAISSPLLGKTLAVVGSGQGASELVQLLLNNNNKVYWCVNKELKINQYPVPSYKLWGPKTALGSYYRLLKTPEERGQYLREVKAWQPSITPAMKYMLEDPQLNIINPTSTLNLQPIFEEVSQVIISCGINPKLSLLPFEDHPIFNPYFPDLPLLTHGFKSSIPNVYFTGLLALAYDGPRQGSVISAALTAKEIIEDILQSNA